MSQVQHLIAWCSDTWNIFMNNQDEEGVMARRFQELVVTERRLKLDIEVVHVFYWLRKPDIIEVEYRSKVVLVIYGVEVDGVTLVESDIEPEVIFIEQSFT